MAADYMTMGLASCASLAHSRARGWEAGVSTGMASSMRAAMAWPWAAMAMGRAAMAWAGLHSAGHWRSHLSCRPIMRTAGIRGWHWRSRIGDISHTRNIGGGGRHDATTWNWRCIAWLWGTAYGQQRVKASHRCSSLDTLVTRRIHRGPQSHPEHQGRGSL